MVLGSCVYDIPRSNVDARYLTTCRDALRCPCKGDAWWAARSETMDVMSGRVEIESQLRQPMISWKYCVLCVEYNEGSLISIPSVIVSTGRPRRNGVALGLVLQPVSDVL